MAKFKLNKMVDSASGKVGQMVFKQVGRYTLYTQAPEREKPYSESQIAQRERFKRATAYAKVVLQDPLVKEAYTKSVAGKEFQHAFSAAVKDYLKSPTVDSVDTTAYQGAIGDQISLRVFDSFKVASVRVTLKRADNTVLETGVALQEPDTAQWIYSTTVANAAVAGTQLEVVVTDKPGNTTTFERVL